MALKGLKIGDRTRLIRKAPLASNEKLVLYTLNGYLNRKGIAWPSQKRIASESGLSLRTVQRTFITLRAKKLIRTAVHYRENGYIGSCTTEVLFENFCAQLGYAIQSHGLAATESLPIRHSGVA